MTHVHEKARRFELPVRTQVERAPMRAGREELDVEDQVAVRLHAENLDVRIGKGDDRALRRLEIPDAPAPLRAAVGCMFEERVRREQVRAFLKPPRVVGLVVPMNHGVQRCGHRGPAASASHCSAASIVGTIVVARNRSRAKTAKSFPVPTVAGSLATIAHTPY